MKKASFLIGLALCVDWAAAAPVPPVPAASDRSVQYIVPVRSPGRYWDQAKPAKWDRAGFMELKDRIPVPDLSVGGLKFLLVIPIS